MSGAWQLLIVALALVVVVQAFLILSLYRQFGIVYLGQADARSRDGLQIRSHTPRWEAVDHEGRKWTAEDFAGRPLLLVFAEPRCHPCTKLMPALGEFALAYADRIATIVVGSGSMADNCEMVARFDLTVPVLKQDDSDLAAVFNIVATPFAHVIDSLGTVRAKGIVNTRSDLDGLAGVLSLEREGEVVAT